MAATLMAALLLATAAPLAAQPARSPFEPPPVSSPPLPGLDSPTPALVPAAVRPGAPARPRKTAPPPSQNAPRQLDPNELLAPAGMSLAKTRSPRRRAAQATATANPKANATEGTRWRQPLLYTSLAAAALGAAVGGAALYVAEEKTAEFNRHRVNLGDDAPPEARRCGSRLPDRGAPGCATMLADRDRARRYGIIALGTAGAFALTAVVLLATEPERGEARTRAGRRRQLALSCVPGLGLQAACGLRF
jgi:hypothetical protein